MKSEEPEYQTPQIDLDSEGYFPSFDIQTCSSQELVEFYRKYGLVVFRNVITPEEVELSVDDLWKDTIGFFTDSTDKEPTLKRDDPQTWGAIKGWHKKYGFVGHSVIDQIQFWKNRSNQKVYECFKKTYEAESGKPLKEPLLCNFDRGSMMLPAGINPEWITDSIYHFDIDPWRWVGMHSGGQGVMKYNGLEIHRLLSEGNYTPYVGYTKLAGVLALSDTNQKSGGFQCACGFQNYIKRWCQKYPDEIQIEGDENLVNNFRKIYMRKGSLLMFSRELPHNIYPNLSTNFRYAQYLRMSPESSLCLTPQAYEDRKQLVAQMLPPNLDVSDPVSQQIYMLSRPKDKKRCSPF